MRTLKLWRGCISIVGLTAVLMAAESDQDRQGWHGEIMPEGLVKADKEGEYRWKKDGSLMVYVPAGPFTMGSQDARHDELPVRQVHLDAFYIDKHEATFGQWKQSGLKMPKKPFWGYLDHYPVVNVSWNDLQPYLEWSGKRLPSEAEWEKAARGTDGRSYPWGEDPPTLEHLIWMEHPIARISTGPVNCCAQGASPYGALNMAGNVYEWCQDLYSASFYSEGPDTNPVNTSPSRYRTLRGGSFVHGMKLQRTFFRYRLLPIDRTPYIGFRTAVSGVSRQAQRAPSKRKRVPGSGFQVPGFLNFAFLFSLRSLASRLCVFARNPLATPSTSADKPPSRPWPARRGSQCSPAWRWGWGKARSCTEGR